MGSFLSSFTTQQPKKEQKQIIQSNNKEQIQPISSFIHQKPTQSKGEQTLQNGNISFNEQQLQGQPQKMIKGDIFTNQLQSQEAIIIDQSGKLIRQVSECKQNKFCYECKQIIEETLIQIVCQHEFHQNCFIYNVEKQLQQKEKFIIKCKCGTKLNPNILRQIVDVQIRSKILFQIFSLQVLILLQNSNIRKYCDVQQIQQMIELNTNKEDYDFQYNEKKQELSKNITEYILDQSGILHLSQQQLFIVSICLYCGKEINSSLLKLNCGHIYHQECFINWLQYQIQDKKSPIIKCRCGTKINPNIIRRIPESQIRLKLLNYLFSVQLSKILPYLRKIEDFDSIYDLYYQNQYQVDQDYDSSSGFLYFSNYSTPGGD
ncbi:unnamed protein product [Paramecium primaurelia]|uniref:RING-type domain-containing protein n=1 Tax=Paramecium primaurelia TaxID=5886 RepID=A0A8S1QJF0_PARPR|nr:unnamed protein product [Paramecium primaurelia]